MSGKQTPVVDLTKPRVEPIDISSEDRQMLSDLAEFAESPERVHWAGEQGLIPDANIREHEFYLGPYRGTYSWTKMPDGIVYRTMTLGQPHRMPDPGAVTSIAEHLGFTGSRHDVRQIHPGPDWQLSVAAGDPGYLILFQPVVDPSRN